MVVEVEDENDVSPAFAKAEWQLRVPEGRPPDTVLATLPVLDPDASNQFRFRVSNGRRT